MRRSFSRLFGSSALVIAALVGSTVTSVGPATANSAWFGQFGGERELPAGTLSVGLHHRDTHVCGNVVPGALHNNWAGPSPQPRIVAGELYNLTVHRSRNCAGPASAASAYRLSVDQDKQERNGFNCHQVVFIPGYFKHRWLNCSS